MDGKRLAVVTGGSSGIGLELARCCAKDGYDLLIAADEPMVEEAADELRREGGKVDALFEDLSTTEGADRLVAALGNRAVVFRMAQTPVQRYLPKLMQRIVDGDIDPSFVITHEGGLDEGPELYKTFRDKKDGCVKVVLHP